MLDFHHWPEGTGFLDYLKRTRPGMEDVQSTPYDLLEKAGTMTLRKYHASPTYTATTGKRPLPVVIIPSVINRSFVLDLLPEKSFIRHFMSQGHDVYLIDWGEPSKSEQNLSFDTLLNLYLDFFLKRVQADRPNEKMHLVGHCMGGTICFMLANLMPERFQSLALLTSPVKFQEKDRLSTWASNEKFDVPAFAEAYGNVPWPILQFTFIGLKPTQLTAKVRGFLAKSKDQRFLRNFWAMESWSNDNIDLRAGCFKVLMDDLYRKNALLNDRLVYNGKRIQVANHALPTFVLIAKNDHIVAAGCHLTPDMVPHVKNFQTVVCDGGHIGALLGGAAQRAVWPKYTEWIKNCEN